MKWHEVDTYSSDAIIFIYCLIEQVPTEAILFQGMHVAQVRETTFTKHKDSTVNSIMHVALCEHIAVRADLNL